MRNAIWICVGLLLILHQDYWQWGNAALDFGFLPRAMTYHVALSILAAVLWLLATKVCWPADLSGEEAQTADDQENDS
ncbi:MAG: hypothetical protein AAF802_11905 [Planctomycetota bacterium]